MTKWSRIASQFLRQLRGKRSQRAWCNRLGYRSLAVSNWENGRRFPDLSETLRICEVNGLDLEERFTRFDQRIGRAWKACSAETLSYEERSVLLLTSVAKGQRITDLARRSGLSRYTISRCLAGKSKIRLHDFLNFLQASTGRTVEWLDLLADTENMPALQKEKSSRSAALHAAYAEPWCELVLRVLETSAYQEQPKHQDAYLAKRLGIGVEKVSDCLALLLRAEVIRQEQQKYRVRNILSVDTNVGGEVQKLRKSFWARVATDRYVESYPNEHLAYNTFSCSREEIPKLRDILRRAFAEARATIASSEPIETAGLLTMQLVQF